MSDPNETVLAYHTVSREKRYVPAQWIDDELSPFPGQWRAAESTLGELGTETSTHVGDIEAGVPPENIAGDADTLYQPEEPAPAPVPPSDPDVDPKAVKAKTKASGQ
jgi:hypothetical protein